MTRCVKELTYELRTKNVAGCVLIYWTLSWKSRKLCRKIALFVKDIKNRRKEANELSGFFLYWEPDHGKCGPRQRLIAGFLTLWEPNVAPRSSGIVPTPRFRSLPAHRKEFIGPRRIQGPLTTFLSATESGISGSARPVGLVTLPEFFKISKPRSQFLRIRWMGGRMNERELLQLDVAFRSVARGN